MSDTPLFVNNYIAFLQNLRQTSPDTFNSIYGISDSSNVSLVPSRQTNASWTISTVDNTTNDIIGIIAVDPSAPQPTTGAPEAPDPGSSPSSPSTPPPPTTTPTSPAPPPTTAPRTAPSGALDTNPAGQLPLTPPLVFPSITPSFVTSSASLTNPYTPPPNAFEASSVTDMISFSPSNADRTFIYDVGVPSRVLPITYTIRNNTISNTLNIQFTRPSFTKISMPPSIQIAPLQQINVTITLNELVAKTLSTLAQRTILGAFDWTVTPLNVTGPIYIQRGLAPIVSTNVPPAVQETTSINTIDISDTTFTHVFLSLSPLISRIKAGEHTSVQIEGWIGDSSVLPGADGAVALQFGPNSVQWQTQKTNTLDIDNLNGTGIVSIAGLIPGSTDITARIFQPPANVSAAKWAQLMSAASIIGDGQQLSSTTIQIVGAVVIDNQ